jgi:hypothetical protein
MSVFANSGGEEVVVGSNRDQESNARWERPGGQCDLGYYLHAPDEPTGTTFSRLFCEAYLMPCSRA